MNLRKEQKIQESKDVERKEEETLKGEKVIKKEKKKKEKYSFRKEQKKQEEAIFLALKNAEPGSAQSEALIKQLAMLASINKEDRASMDNIVAAATSITGLFMAVGYDQAHNLPKAANSFVRRPGTVLPKKGDQNLMK